MIAANILSIKEKLPADVALVAVSKLQNPESVLEAYAAGQRHFGENRAQEFAFKQARLPADIVWHFIGHLQTNKVKMVVGKAELIHSVDSERLLWAIEKEALKQGIQQDCLLEVHIAVEESKSGFSKEELEALISQPEFRRLQSVKICGIMGMASFVSDEQQIRAEFRRLKHIYDRLQQSVFAGNPDFRYLSMGMSGDWPIAIEEGSTLIRIGSQIFTKTD
ncbi:MAG: YggS family pyridoxal phosphate-dependent enzyme [Bacteroidales bacterium]|nr:YggS family pyridoxal phosphate-dependent enzyme [Bacteroidales bacterium]MCL2738307.1 YggS family pyridoxal phosphate-dependent enzyme [Bacteroidales bacterium]